MISGLYSAATAMDAATRRHEVASENLAHVQMPGYRKRVLTQTTFDTLSPPMRDVRNDVYSSKLLGTATKPVSYDFSQGHFEETKRPLDVAISGEGFLTVQGPNGQLFTRNGSLYVQPDGALTTVDKLPVIGAAGPIVLPPGVTSEAVEISRDGRLYSNGVEFGQLSLVEFVDNSALTPMGASLFSVTGDAQPQPSDAEVLQGHLELANTSTIDEMINLIQGTREFEAAQKALQTIAESIQKRIGLR